MDDYVLALRSKDETPGLLLAMTREAEAAILDKFQADVASKQQGFLKFLSLSLGRSSPQPPRAAPLCLIFAVRWEISTGAYVLRANCIWGNAMSIISEPTSGCLGRNGSWLILKWVVCDFCPEVGLDWWRQIEAFDDCLFFGWWNCRSWIIIEIVIFWLPLVTRGSGNVKNHLWVWND